MAIRGNQAVAAAEETGVTVERYLRLIAGFFVMLSVALGYYGNPLWFLFTAFVGLNLFPRGLHRLVPHDDHLAQAGCVKVRGGNL